MARKRKSQLKDEQPQPTTSQDMPESKETEEVKEPAKGEPKSPAPSGNNKGDGKTEAMLGQVLQALGNFNSRLTKLEGGDKNEFQYEAKKEDIELAQASREGVEPRICKIVDELLGTDFGIEITPQGDRPGFLFTLIVPQRLSDLPLRQRPIVNPETKEYVLDQFGKVKEETYNPVDKRSRAIASYQSFDAIRNHCERVRSYIVAYYQNAKKPLPEFRLTSI